MLHTIKIRAYICPKGLFGGFIFGRIIIGGLLLEEILRLKVSN